MTIGILGGFGAYATLDFYQRFLHKFSLKTERNLPHMILDNNFTMPSRTRALLTGEAYDEIVADIAESMKLMVEKNADCVALICGTAHYFLPDVYKIIPEAEDIVIDMLDCLGVALKNQQVTKALVIAAEGTLHKKLYSEKLRKYGVVCIEPEKEFYDEIRYFIECVKQNRYDSSTKERFECFLNSFQEQHVVLGCTEFPSLVRTLGVNTQRIFHDPTEYMIDMLYSRVVNPNLS